MIPEYALPVVAGIVVTLLYPAAPHVRAPENKRGYRALLIVTIVCGIAGAKLVALMGDRMWPMVPLEDGWSTVVNSGRSIVGGLLFGHLASEIARPLIGYTAPPNDRLAVSVCIGVAVGRVGCTMAGCCLGIPWDGPLALAFTHDGVARFPASLVDLAFQLVAAVVFFALERKRVLFGRLFSTYLIAYGVFRFAVEPWRATPKELAGGLSVYQAFAVALVVVGTAGLVWRTWSPTWRTRLGLAVTP